jgi:hypothetical protein
MQGLAAYLDPQLQHPGRTAGTTSSATCAGNPVSRVSRR